MRGWACVGIAAAMLMGCSSDDGGGGSSPSTARATESQCKSACDKMIGCGSTNTDCVTDCLGQNLPAACTTAISKASCEEMKSTSPPYAETCYPSCSTESYACVGSGEIKVCDGSSQMTLDCTYVCQQSGKTYADSCGTEYNGQKSSSGHAVCWCK